MYIHTHQNVNSGGFWVVDCTKGGGVGLTGGFSFIGCSMFSKFSAMIIYQCFQCFQKVF